MADVELSRILLSVESSKNLRALIICQTNLSEKSKAQGGNMKFYFLICFFFFSK